MKSSLGFTKCSFEELRGTTNYAVRCLQDDLHRAQLVPRPLLTYMRSTR
jgi:hypothetical protein